MDERKIKSVLESLLLVSERPLAVREMNEAMGGVITDVEIETVLNSLKAGYEAVGMGLRLREAAGGWQYHTPEENADIVKNLLKLKPQKLSPAALETLAIIAYKQPVTRPEMEAVRGVDCGGVVKVLLDRHLIRILGKKDEAGRPFIYGTTKEFLEFFHLKNLTDLPTLKDFEQLSREFNEKAEKAAQAGQAVIGESKDTEKVSPVEAAGVPATSTSPDEKDVSEATVEVEIAGDTVSAGLMQELTDAISRLDSSQKQVVEKLGLDEKPDKAGTETETATVPAVDETGEKGEQN